MGKLIFISLMVVLYSCNTTYEDIVKSSTITASAEYQGMEAKNLLDSNMTTMWNAGGSGQHWLEFSLNKSSYIEKMYFVVNTLPAANGTYNILVKKQEETDFKNINSGTFFFNSRDSIKYEMNEKNIEKVRLVIQNDSSWVCVSHASILVKK